VEQRTKRDAEAMAGAMSPGGSSSALEGPAGSHSGVGIDGGGSFRLGMNDKRRSWLMFPPSSTGDEGEAVEIVKKKGRCC
jgi:hypothetical protein